MEEKWIDAVGLPGAEVSNMGRVREKETGGIIEGHIDNDMARVRVCLNGTRKTLHRVVYDSFKPNDGSLGKSIRHIDGDPTNNRLDNLVKCVDDVTRHKVVVTRCKDCKNRYKYPQCSGQTDDFYCAFGSK